MIAVSSRGPGIADGVAERRPFALVLAAVAALAWALRAWPLAVHGVWQFPIFDEGYYFSAAVLLYRGIAPYRDFFLVHPPGLLYVLAPTAGLLARISPNLAFESARWMATIVGAANTLLIGRLAARSFGGAAGIVAAGLYATCPEIVWNERGVTLEPILNLACLVLATTWLGGRTEARTTRSFTTGLLLGFAASVKAWGALWIVPCAFSIPSTNPRRHARALAAGMLLGGLLLIGPFFVLSPRDFLADTVLFQIWRVPQAGGWFVRLQWIVLDGARRPSLAALTMLSVVGLAMGVTRWRAAGRAARFSAVAYLVVLLALWSSPVWIRNYPAHLDLTAALLAGLPVSKVWPTVRATPARTAAAILLFAAMLAPPIRRAALETVSRDAVPSRMGQAIRTMVPPEACLAGMYPEWELASGRVPASNGSSRTVNIPDAMHFAAVATGARFADVDAAFSSDAAQTTLRRMFDSCRFLAFNTNEYVTPATLAWVRTRYVQRFPAGDRLGPSLWERMPESK